MQGVLKLAVLAIAMSVLVPVAALAQGGTIRGRVADTTGAAIADAVVWVEATALRVMTSASGEYVLSAVPPGTAIVRVRRIGYVDIAPAARVVVVAGGTVQQDFTLRNVANTLAPIVVGSRATHTAADELAVPVDVFTPEMIRSQGTTETAQILAQLAPSVNFPRQSVSDASEIVSPNNCPYRRWWVDRALAAQPRDRFDYVWMLNPPPFDPELTDGMSLVWSGAKSRLYRITPGGAEPRPATLLQEAVPDRQVRSRGRRSRAARN